MTIATFDDFTASRAPEAQTSTDDGTSLAALLARRDDRLIEDAGLSRAALLTPYELFLEETRRERSLWTL